MLVSLTLHLWRTAPLSCRRGTSFVFIKIPFHFFKGSGYRLNMEVDLQCLFGLHFTWCTQLYLLAETPELPPLPPHLDSYYEGAIGHQRLTTSLCNPLVVGNEKVGTLGRWQIIPCLGPRWQAPIQRLALPVYPPVTRNWCCKNRIYGLIYAFSRCPFIF